MKLQTETYTIESDHHGYSLTVKIPSEHEKSKTGFTEKKTFHANLRQVAEKMMGYELLKIGDAQEVAELAATVDSAALRLSRALYEQAGAK